MIGNRQAEAKNWTGGYKHGGSEQKGRSRYYGPFLRSLRNLSTVVDFGCGGGSFGQLVRKHAVPTVRLVGCDGYEPSVELCRTLGYNEVYLSNMVEFSTRPEADGEVWMFGDVLEHLDEKRADFVLETARKRGVEAVLISIPVGPYPQGAPKHNPLEEHRWTFWPSKLAEWKALWTPELFAVVAVAGDKRRPDHVGDFRDLPEYQAAREHIGHLILKPTES